jgi:SpoVK/Ycf46/Vps4 family AAA+-type ATPase
VFLATTNYPADLGERIMNRPSRFDKRFKIGFPTAEARQLYFEYLIQNNEKDDESVPDSVKDMKIDIKQWVKDTKGFSVSHLKELFIAVVILGDSYEEAVETLQTMMDVGSNVEKEESGGVGFHAEPGKDSNGW